VANWISDEDARARAARNEEAARIRESQRAEKAEKKAQQARERELTEELRRVMHPLYERCLQTMREFAEVAGWQLECKAPHYWGHPEASASIETNARNGRDELNVCPPPHEVRRGDTYIRLEICCRIESGSHGGRTVHTMVSGDLIGCSRRDGVRREMTGQEVAAGALEAYLREAWAATGHLKRRRFLGLF
jgi:hypothetical protein